MKGALQPRLEHILPQASEGLRPGGFRFCLSGQSRKRVEAWAWSAPRCGAPGRVIAKRAVSRPISKVLTSAPVLHMFALVRSLPEGRRPGAPAQSPVVERACENADPEQERAGPRARFRSRGKTAGEGRRGAGRIGATNRLMQAGKDSRIGGCLTRWENVAAARHRRAFACRGQELGVEAAGGDGGTPTAGCDAA